MSTYDKLNALLWNLTNLGTVKNRGKFVPPDFPLKQFYNIDTMKSASFPHKMVSKVSKMVFSGLYKVLPFVGQTWRRIVRRNFNFRSNFQNRPKSDFSSLDRHFKMALRQLVEAKWGSQIQNRQTCVAVQLTFIDRSLWGAEQMKFGRFYGFLGILRLKMARFPKGCHRRALRDLAGWTLWEANGPAGC